ncbi:MAG: c-type cytochrome [Bacteroidota bacterium]
MRKLTYCLAFAILGTIVFQSCSPSKGNNPGHEYMPDMAHSISYEANHVQYYSFNTWETKDSLMSYYLNPLKPVEGTIPRGYAGLSTAVSAEAMEAKAAFLEGKPVNGFVPYYYENTEEERTRASEEITTNPFPITAAGVAKGKDLYNIYCGICHGDKADGNGYIVREDGGVYPAQPANLINEEFTAASEGRFYHALIYGKNVMGGYTDKLSYEERWQVIHYIRSLQAKEAGVEYIVEASEETEETDALAENAEENEETSDDGEHGEDHSGGEHN